jgi:DNA-directed RNA polymerase II subunit RPB1
MFLKAARHGELDIMRGVSANVMCGQQGYFGTSAFQILADINAMMEHESEEYIVDNENILDTESSDNVDTINQCGINNLTINNNAINIKNVDLGKDDDYEIEF